MEALMHRQSTFGHGIFYHFLVVSDFVFLSCLWSCKYFHLQCMFALCNLNPCLDLEIFPQMSQGWETSLIMWLASMCVIIFRLHPSFPHTLHILAFCHIFTDVHLLIQLLGICTDQSNWAGAASASCIWKDLWLGYYFDFKRLADVLHWKPYFTRFVHFSLSFAFAFCGRWHVSHMCLVSVVPHITCVLCCKCAVCVTCVLCHVCDCVSCVKDTQGQLSSGLFLLVVALVRALAVFGFVPDKVPALDKQWEEEKRQSRDRVGKSLRSWKMSSICKHCRTGNGWVQDTRIILDHWVEKYPKGKKKLSFDISCCFICCKISLYLSIGLNAALKATVFKE